MANSFSQLEESIRLPGDNKFRIILTNAPTFGAVNVDKQTEPEGALMFPTNYPC